MDPDAPIGGNRRGFRRWRWGISLIAGIPLVAFGLSNAVLSHPRACQKIARIIQRKTQLETHVKSASWSPWNGATLNTVELLMPPALRAGPDPALLRINSVRVTPAWRSLLRGKLVLGSIELDTPRVVLTKELISFLARAAQPEPAPPMMAAAPPTPSNQAAQPPPAPPLVLAPTAPTGQSAATKPPIHAPPAPAPPVFLRLKNASFAVVTGSPDPAIIELSSITGAIPIAGGPALSSLKIGRISAIGKDLASNLTASLDWTSPLLSLQPLETQSGGCKMVIAGKLAILRGLPLQIEAAIPPQKLAPCPLLFGAVASAESITVSARFRGILLAPGTWQGDCAVESASPTLQVADHPTKFERGGALAVLRGGVISCVDARMISDELSLLGNATVFADGRAAGAARVVAAPESAAALAKRIFPDVAGIRPLTPLGTPQRAAFDLEAFGSINQLFLRLGKDGPLTPLFP